MTKEDVLELLETNKDERGIAHWEKLGKEGIKSFGIGLTRLKKLAKQIGKDHPLALALWKLPVYDAKILATIIDNPKEVTRAQVEEQVQELHFWMLAHSYCSNLMPRVSFLKEVADEWATSEENVKRHCAYLLLYQLAKDNKQLENSYFDTYLDIIEEKIQSEENFVKDGMNNALLMIGQRNKTLNERALTIARKVGKIEVDYGDNSCEAVDCVKHLSSERIQKKIAK